MVASLALARALALLGGFLSATFLGTAAAGLTSVGFFISLLFLVFAADGKLPKLPEMVTRDVEGFEAEFSAFFEPKACLIESLSKNQ